MSLAAAKSVQSCPILWDPIDSSPAGSSIPGILQARTLEWVAISFSNTWKWKVKVKSFSHVQLLETPWTVAYQAPPSKGFSRQEYWSGVPLPSQKMSLIYPQFKFGYFLFLLLYLTTLAICFLWIHLSLSLRGSKAMIEKAVLGREEGSTEAPIPLSVNISSVQLSHSVVSNSLRPHRL